MTNDERSRASRRKWFAAAAGIVVISLTACQQSPTQPVDNRHLPPASDVGMTSSPATTVATAVGQTCTNAWRNHGHTTQREAKAFLKECLAAQGVEGESFDRTRVLALLERLIPASSELTSVVPIDIATFCPDYVRQDTEGRAGFWRGLLLAMVEPESGFQTTTAYWEEGGLQQFSIGLLQLSYTDARSYACDFTNEADIVDPARNLDCGVRIMTSLVGKDRSIGTRDEGRWLGGARYWSVLRNTSDARADIVRTTSNLPMCLAG